MVSLKGCIVALSVVYLSLSALVNAAEAAAGAGGISYCATASDKAMCENVTKTATNWNQAMTMGLKEAMKHSDSIILKSKTVSLGKSKCGETYDNINARLKECMDLVNKGDANDEINFKLSAAVTGLEDCEIALEVLKDENTPFYESHRHFNHILDVCLAIDKSKHEKSEL
ncbi:PREDICTED: uncharacterized protein LOC109147308 [Ipomoea nil]|uniref:uncharacterized protein LOC109147308 n=1 Tax=Ipomoea nil TaxID=35883 RepID=UPI0009011BB1|nr:PREDICTED: uncharacterized protein LOC109147308 [Ipomoea nil]XP_019150513.1 PREDICTED: uncharacterized protein LOC109147308 [Ipomoea nil]